MAGLASRADLIMADAESDHAAAIAASPSDRGVYVAAANYFDSVNEVDSASSLHNGVVPPWMIEKYQLEKYESRKAAQISSCQAVGWYPATSESLSPPINSDTNRNSVFISKSKNCPHEALNILHGGGFVYDGKNKLFVDSNNIRISDHSDVNSYLSHTLAGPVSESAVALKGLSILLSARNSGNFYHWHFDILPALGLVQECGISISEIDNIVLTKKESSFHLPMLKLLGVRDEQIHLINPGYEYIRCEKLLLATIRNGMGMRQPRKHIDWLRSSILPAVKKRDHSPVGKKLAIVRDVRGYSDAKLVIDYFSERGYEVFKPEEYPYIEQVAAFHNATHIVSPHGAGLALLAYCAPGTVVYEFYGEHVHPCFWSISSSLGLKYYNYNCSQINEGAVTNSGRGAAERLNKSIDVTSEILASLVNL